MASSRRHRSEEADRQRAFLADVRAALKRAPPPTKVPASLREQLLGLLHHWFRMKRGVVHPGMKKLAHWGGVTDKQARTNMRQLQAWEVAISCGYEAGGRDRATRYVISLPALFRVLQLIRANPSEFIRKFCHEKAEVDPSFPATNQTLASAHLSLKPQPSEPLRNSVEVTAKPGSRTAQNPEVNPEETSAGKREDTYGTAEGLAGREAPPSVSRSAGASLFASSPKKQVERARKGEHPTSAGGSAGDNENGGAADYPRDPCEPEHTLKLREPPAGRSAGASLVCLEKINSEAGKSGEHAAQTTCDLSPGSHLLSADGATYLEHLANGPTTYGAAATWLGWSATRSSRADAEVIRLGLAFYDEKGRTVLRSSCAEPAPPFWGASRSASGTAEFTSETPRKASR